ncbi:hypothetical protein F7725_025727 [Dissostichus mawsoni]|uniref:Uncharacterized protein n=1 Tax=Dissostichus mawsoni TaxID=36200 RepID=A0A7J5X530_DISMA|nr:hypothetical protein F7725_025727 [Dissostichus mawsoni]
MEKPPVNGETPQLMRETPQLMRETPQLMENPINERNPSVNERNSTGNERNPPVNGETPHVMSALSCSREDQFLAEPLKEDSASRRGTVRCPNPTPESPVPPVQRKHSSKLHNMS